MGPFPSSALSWRKSWRLGDTISTMEPQKTFAGTILRILFVIALWFGGFLLLTFFSFATLELGGTYGAIATNIFGASLILLLGIYTYKVYKRLRT